MFTESKDEMMADEMRPFALAIFLCSILVFLGGFYCCEIVVGRFEIVVGRCGSLWVVLRSLWVVVGRFEIVVGRCGSF